MVSPLEARQLVRKRLRDDFDFYAANALQIRTKTVEIVPLQLNEAQRRLIDAVNAQWAAEGKVRVIILKARQMGLSTAVGGWLYYRASQHRAQKALVMTHKAESTAALFDMTKRYYENTPQALRPSTKYSSISQSRRLARSWSIMRGLDFTVVRKPRFTVSLSSNLS